MEFAAIPKLVIPNQEFIACGPFSGASISTKGQLSYWGPNLVKKKEKPFKKPEKFTHKGHLVSVAIGREHMLMLDDTGDLYAVGEGADGQLGTGYYDPQAEPVKVFVFFCSVHQMVVEQTGFRWSFLCRARKSFVCAR